MKSIVLAIALLALACPSHLWACKPSPEWTRLGIDEQMERLFGQSLVVAHVRVVEVLSKYPRREYDTGVERGRAAKVEVVESFKGPADFSSVTSEMNSCGIDFWMGRELVIFSGEPLVLNSIRTRVNQEIPRVLPILRTLRDRK